MSQPTLSEVHVSVPLTNISVNFLQRPDAFLAGRVFPIVPVMKKSDKYFTYTAADFNRTDVAVRAPGVPAPRSGYSVSTDSYNCERRALAHDIADPIRENMDSPLAADQDALAFVMNQMMVDAEIQWAAKYFTTSVWTGSSTGSDITPSVLWDDAASTPVEDVKKEIRAVELATYGYPPNTFVMGRTLFDKLCDNPDVLDRIKHAAGPGNPAIANERTLAALFGVERVIVSRAVKNTAAEGAAASKSRVADPESGLLVYAAPNPSLRAPSGGYTFTWMGTGNPFGIQIKQYRRPEEFESDSVEANFYFDHKLVSSLCGAFFSNAVSA